MIELIGGIKNQQISLSRSDAAKAAMILQKLIACTLEASIMCDIKDGVLKPILPYINFCEVLDKHRKMSKTKTTLISMNYDLLLDYSLFYTNTKYRYGFESHEDQWNRVDLLKLHGSLNWGRDRNDGKIHVDGFGETYDVYGQGEIPTVSGVDSGQARLELRPNWDREKIDFPYIIPPSANKISKQRELQDIWSQASMALNQAEVIFFVGYSVPESDSFFKDFFALSTYGPADFEKIVVINPDILAKDRVGSLLSAREIDSGILEYHDMKFEDSIETIEAIIREYETNMGGW